MVFINKQAIKAVGITTLVFCLVLVAYIAFTSLSVDNQQPDKVYKDLSEMEEKIVYQNIKALQQSQRINTTVKKSDNITPIVETNNKPGQANSLVENQDKGFQEDNMKFNQPVTNEESGKSTKSEIESYIPGIGNGLDPRLDPSKVRVVTHEELGATPIFSTDIQDLYNYIDHLEGIDNPAAQIYLNTLRDAANRHRSITNEND